MTEELLKKANTLIGIVEGIENLEYGTWRNEKLFRLKDTEEWVSFYVAVKNANKSESPSTWHPAEYKVKEQMYLGEISDQQEIIQKLLDVIREVYALSGEDPEINRICNSALEQFSG